MRFFLKSCFLFRFACLAGKGPMAAMEAGCARAPRALHPTSCRHRYRCPCHRNIKGRSAMRRVCIHPRAGCPSCFIQGMCTFGKPNPDSLTQSAPAVIQSDDLQPQWIPGQGSPEHESDGRRYCTAGAPGALWGQQYSLIDGLRPAFITPALAATIMRAGKSLIFLRFEACQSPHPLTFGSSLGVQ